MTDPYNLSPEEKQELAGRNKRTLLNAIEQMIALGDEARELAESLPTTPAEMEARSPVFENVIDKLQELNHLSGGWGIAMSNAVEQAHANEARRRADQAEQN